MIRKLSHLPRCSSLHSCFCGFIVKPGSIISNFHPRLREHQKNCSLYRSWRSKISKKNGARGWEVVLERGPDGIAEYKKNMSRSVSLAIMADPVDRARRREVAKRGLNRWAVSEVGRRKASEIAKITSARPEILQMRTEQLRKWRVEHPEEFSRTVEKFSSSFQSRPEIELFLWLNNLDQSFKRSQFLKDDRFETKTKKRQIDILSSTKKCIIEFDGPYHFRDIGNKKFLDVQKKDSNLDDIASSLGYSVIRVSYDQYSYSRVDGGFERECLERLKELIEKGVPGVFKIGEMYGESNLLSFRR